MSRLIFVDVETTGLDPEIHEIIECCLLIREPGGHETIFTWKIKPENIENAHPTALRVNGYSEALWDHAISQKEAADLISEKCRDAIMVGHNVLFDLRFLNHLLEDQQVENKIPDRWICTQEIARSLQSDLDFRSVSLDSIRRSLGWTLEGAHTAEKDVLDCARLYDHLKNFIASLV